MTIAGLIKAKEREAAELQKLHDGFRWHADYQLAVQWRARRIANVDFHLQQLRTEAQS